MSKSKNAQAIFCLVVFFLFLVPYHAHAAEWIGYWSSNTGDAYYDKSSIKQNKNIVRVWLKIIHNEEGKIDTYAFLKKIGSAPSNPDILNHSVILEEIDCAKEMNRFSSMAFYDEVGNIIYTTPRANNEWADIIPESNVEKLKNIVCGDGKTSKTK
jgi:hypothetical protein